MMNGSGLFWQPGNTPEKLNAALRILRQYGYLVTEGQGAIELSFIEGTSAILSVKKDERRVIIQHDTIAGAMRGISFALAGKETMEKNPFTSFGIMMDCSRNKVFTVDFLKRYFLQTALFGCNSAMIYTEDTYQLPSEPFFGYMRGGYTLEELQELDDFCRNIGVELSACIQTLGHMEHMLQWEFAYKDIMESPNVLLAGNEQTYALIDKMLAFWSKALRSRKIHLGMDEAHDLGRGRNFDLHPGVPPQDLFHLHLAEVNRICRKYGFNSPMIWSDMYFRLSNPSHKYYGCSEPLPETVGKRIPLNVRLCYWDYYHETEDFYDRYIDLHRTLGFEPMMFSGLWTWAKFWYDHQFTEKTIRPCIAVCRKKNIRELFFTMWGDDGGYCCYSSALAGLCFAADLAAGIEDGESTADRYQAVTGKDYKLVLAMSKLEQRVVDDPANLVIGDAASLLWDDPLLAINWRGLIKLKPEFPQELDLLLTELLQKLDAVKESWKNDSDFRMLHSLMIYLRHKYRFRISLEEAYTANSRTTLSALLGEIPAIQQEMKNFMEVFRANWLEGAKRFGLEVHQARNAGQLERLYETERILKDYLGNQISAIPEIDASKGIAEIGYQRIHYRHLASGSMIK